MKPARRVVITGLGAITPLGTGKETFWQASIAGHSGIRRITRFDASTLATRIAGEVPDFDALSLGLTAEEARVLDRGTQFALAAASLALLDSGLPLDLDEEQRDAIGVYVGTAMSAGDEGEKLWLLLTDKGTRTPHEIDLGTLPITVTMGYMPASAIAAHYNLHGPCEVFSTGCSSGADAIGQAYWIIQEGRAARMLAGGSDSAISMTGINVFSVMKALSTRNDAPEEASRPYDGQRDGFVLAEGAGMLLLEDRELALARHAHIYAEVIGFVSNSNAYHMTALPEDGQPLQQLLRQAMQEANITPQQIGYINSHGSSTPFNERVETAAYKAVFGEHAYRIPISSTKSMIGHTQGAASAIETIVTALALDQQIIPPTINQQNADPDCDLDYVPNVARKANFDVALTHSSGFGGVNGVLMLARADMVGKAEIHSRATGQSYEGRGTTQSSLVPRRVVVTGLGVVAPQGIGKEAFWHATSNGVSGIKPIQRISTRDLPVQVAGEVSNFEVERYLGRKLVNRTDRMTHLALAAVQEALDDAHLALEQESPQRVGTVIANTVGGVGFVIEQVQAMYARGPRAMSAYSAIAWLQVANAGQTSVSYGLQGYSKTTVNDLAGGLDALGVAFRAIQRGAADVIIAGGCEAMLHPYILILLAQGGYCVPGDDPRAYRPFDRRARGLVLAEGAGICILEEYEHARRRGATIYGEIAGFGQTNDAYGLHNITGDGSRYARAMSLSMQEAGLRGADIGYFSLDGRATLAADQVEADALYRCFGPDMAASMPVSVPRSMAGHSYAAAGAIDTITALLSLEHAIIPPTINCDQPDPRYQLRLVRDEACPMARSSRAVLLGARSIGGVNSTLALRKV